VFVDILHAAMRVSGSNQNIKSLSRATLGTTGVSFDEAGYG